MCAGEALSVPLSDASSVILGPAPKAGCPFMFSLKLLSVLAGSLGLRWLFMPVSAGGHGQATL